MFRAVLLVAVITSACNKKSESPPPPPTPGSAAPIASGSDAAVAPAPDLTGVYTFGESSAFSIIAGPTKTLMYYEFQWREEGFACECVSEVKHVDGIHYTLSPVDDGLEGPIKISGGEISGEGLIEGECCAPGWPGLHINPGKLEPLTKCKAKPAGGDLLGWTAGDEVEAAPSNKKTTIARFRKGGELHVEKVDTELLDCPKRESK